MSNWKLNSNRGSYWREEEGVIELKKDAKVYADFDKNSRVVRKYKKGTTLIYREIILINKHVWAEFAVGCSLYYIPIRTWNGVPPTQKEYDIGLLEHNIKGIKREGKPMKKETKDGVDIYIDRDKEIMYISMNQKMTYESQERLKESIRSIKGYEIMVFDYINDIKFLN